MAEVLIAVLRSRFCDACTGSGTLARYRGTPVGACPSCNGSGDVPEDYLIEIATDQEHVEDFEDMVRSERGR